MYIFSDLKEVNSNTILRDKFYARCQHRSSFECNFVLSHIDTMAAFISGEKRYTGIFAILNGHYEILLLITTTAYIHSCGISDDGKFAIFNTANSDTDDGGKCFFVDISENRLLWKRQLQENWKSIRSYYIDDISNTIYIYHDTCRVEYDFNGNIKKR